MATGTTTTIETTRLMKLIEVVGFAIGPAVTAYYVTNFTVDQHGYYYRNTELGIAIGVFLISLACALRYWRHQT
jgi:hypothetical protein